MKNKQFIGHAILLCLEIMTLVALVGVPICNHCPSVASHACLHKSTPLAFEFSFSNPSCEKYIDGYRIYYGFSDKKLAECIDIPISKEHAFGEPQTAQLPRGTYQFRIDCVYHPRFDPNQMALPELAHVKLGNDELPVEEFGFSILPNIRSLCWIYRPNVVLQGYLPLLITIGGLASFLAIVIIWCFSHRSSNLDIK